ncbi:tripartite tricarboxylate transporter substrate binding protein [Pseudorhodoferax sp. Leaf267]|uniref:Bug family tripartite tricarboxylate transporter substrate binding protein n=1 Tax=Pseudorhodoferax sp. Leaf267 TaxID=1736316 RepID=UPI0006F2C884|nr:tripartite tricarboxylate transporter substrate binding protein [Pseudorhodoferax sp. Leaf267]KQP12197.1 ABC transporter substrate-binding protein [Pseudorhodoferax sp. Leaf267]
MMDRRALLALMAAPAFAADARPWPVRPVRLLVAYATGGVSDDISRALAQRLAERLGQPVLVENRAGAGGSLAMDVLARAPADGHTLCFSAITPLTLQPVLGPVPYDPLQDIAPVAAVMATPVLVLGTPALAARSMGELVQEAGRRHVRWASSGHGTTGHLVLERVRSASGMRITHVPYKGGGQQLNEALGGQFEVLSSNVAALQLQYVRQGLLHALAVGAPQRLDVLPEVPTLAEAGFASANLTSLFGLFAPAHTPADVIGRLNAEVHIVLAQPALRERLLAVSNLPGSGSAQDFAQHIARELAANRQALR